jgi:hypothetical protein
MLLKINSPSYHNALKQAFRNFKKGTLEEENSIWRANRLFTSLHCVLSILFGILQALSWYESNQFSWLFNLLKEENTWFRQAWINILMRMNNIRCEIVLPIFVKCHTKRLLSNISYERLRNTQFLLTCELLWINDFSLKYYIDPHRNTWS